MTYRTELVAALQAVVSAASLTRRVQEGTRPDTLRKGDKSPVTVADFGSQALVCRRLQAYFPDDPVIGEEQSGPLREEANVVLRDRIVSFVREQVSAATVEEVLGWIDRGAEKEYSPRFWTLDPIDGTKGFLRGDQYAVALCLIVEGEPVVAALACPGLNAEGQSEGGVVQWAVKGEGAWQASIADVAAWSSDPDAIAGRSRLAVTSTPLPEGARFCESVEAGHSSHGDSARIAQALGIVREPLRLDSQAKYAVLARGEADIYLRLPTRPGYEEHIWDHAAGVLIVEEAGGHATDMFGNALDFSLGHTLRDNKGVVISNGRFHDAVIRVIVELDIQPA